MAYPIDGRAHSYSVTGLGRSLQRVGRVNSPRAATLQIMRKNQAFNSVAMVSSYSHDMTAELGESPIRPAVSPRSLAQAQGGVASYIQLCRQADKEEQTPTGSISSRISKLGNP